jgi:alcohol dehydrogenase class IV
VKPEVETYAIWAGASVRELARRRWPGLTVSSLDEIPDECPGLVTVGGGRMMDESKYFRARQRPGMRLVLVPSVWGSGAERSPIVVLNREGAKHIEIDPAFLPDDVVYWPELLRTVPVHRAREACGDVWSHALEAFLSPLSGEEMQGELATLIRHMSQLPLATDDRWFQAGARACELQAKTSVGLTHGIAHVLEALMITRHPTDGWGHAKLCSVFLLPVMELNRKNSSKWRERAAQHGIDESAIWAVLKALHEGEAYRQALPLLKENWLRILRDPCTRTNGTLVRTQAIVFFEEWPDR